MKKFREALQQSVVVITLVVLAACTKTPEPDGMALPRPTSAASAGNVADIDVTTNVKTALLQDAGLRGMDITVITTKGDVRLIGVVDTQAQIDAAIMLARGTDGVHAIHDELTLKK